MPESASVLTLLMILPESVPVAANLPPHCASQLVLLDVVDLDQRHIHRVVADQHASRVVVAVCRIRFTV